jgi:hypothetical protein
MTEALAIAELAAFCGVPKKYHGNLKMRRPQPRFGNVSVNAIYAVYDTGIPGYNGYVLLSTMCGVYALREGDARLAGYHGA